MQWISAVEIFLYNMFFQLGTSSGLSASYCSVLIETDCLRDW